MLEVSETEAASLEAQSKAATTEGLTRIMEVLAEGEMRLRDAASKKILVEVTLLKAIEARNAVSLDTVLNQLQKLRDSSGGDVVSIPMPAATPAPLPGPKPVRAASTPSVPTPMVQTPPPAVLAETPAPAQATVSAPSPAPTADSLTTLWDSLVDAVGRASPFARTYLLEAHPVSFQKNLFTIGFDPEFEDHIALVDNSKNHTLLQTKLAELGHPNIQFKFIKAEAPAGLRPADPAPVATPTPPPAPKPAPTVATARSAPPATREKSVPVPFSKDDFKNDPLIQKALEIFKGQIVEVRA